MGKQKNPNSLFFFFTDFTSFDTTNSSIKLCVLKLSLSLFFFKSDEGGKRALVIYDFFITRGEFGPQFLAYIVCEQSLNTY